MKKPNKMERTKGVACEVELKQEDTTPLGLIMKVTGNAEPEDIDLPETSVAFSRAVTG